MSRVKKSSNYIVGHCKDRKLLKVIPTRGVLPIIELFGLILYFNYALYIARIFS